MTITGAAADGLRHGAQPRRLGAVAAMPAGALAGALLLRTDLWVPLALIAAVAAGLARVLGLSPRWPPAPAPPGR
jgi:hypothetical protein